MKRNHVSFQFLLVIRLCLTSSPCSKQQSVIQQLLSRKGRLIVMCTKGDASAVCSNGSCRVIEVPGVADCLQPVINIIPLQVCLELVLLFCVILKPPYLPLPLYYVQVLLTEHIYFVFVFGSVACIPSDCPPWIRCGPTKESGEERDHTVGRRGRVDV